MATKKAQVRNTSGNSGRFFDATWAVREQEYIDGANDLPDKFQAVCLSNQTTEDGQSSDDPNFKRASICVKPISDKAIMTPNGIAYRNEQTPVPGDTLPSFEQVEDPEKLKNLIRFYHTLDYMVAQAEDASAIQEPIRFGQIVNCKFLYGHPNFGTGRALIFEVPRGEAIIHPNYIELQSKSRLNSAKEPFSSNPAALLGALQQQIKNKPSSGSNKSPDSSNNVARKDGSYPIENMKQIIKELKAVGFDNEYVHMGVLAVCAKESGITPIVEKRYNTTNLETIKRVFKANQIYVDDAPFGIAKNKKFLELSDDQITKLKSESPEAFFNVLYGGRFGNGNYKSGDGDKYRGRGYNQLTWKSNYAKMSRLIGVDIETNPDESMKPEIAAKILARFMSDFHNEVWNKQELNSADSPESATKMAADKTGGKKDKEPGRTNALARLPQIKEMFARGDFK